MITNGCGLKALVITQRQFLSFLSGTVIEFSNFNMLSDAGGAGARRRRLCQSLLVTISSLFHFCPVSLMVSVNFATLLLLSTLPVGIFVVSYCWSEFTRVDLFSGDSWITVSSDTSLHLVILYPPCMLFSTLQICKPI